MSVLLSVQSLILFGETSEIRVCAFGFSQATGAMRKREREKKTPVECSQGLTRDSRQNMMGMT